MRGPRYPFIATCARSAALCFSLEATCAAVGVAQRGLFLRHAAKSKHIVCPLGAAAQLLTKSVASVCTCCSSRRYAHDIAARLMLLSASVMTLCGAFVHPRMTHWLPTEGRQPACGLGASKGGAAGLQEHPSGDMWEKTSDGGGGGAAQADAAVEEEAGVMDVRTEGSSSPSLDILHRNEDFAAVCKPPLMHVHRPEFGSRDKEFVMQKARNQLGHRIFLPHRLDRGTSGCLLLGFSPEAGKVLHRALADSTSRKTYVAIVRGSGEAYVGKGWFTVDRPIKDDKKVLREASTRFLFVRGGNAPDPRCCLVLAQPSTGRFHQIRRHLNGISHPVVGDSVHGSSRFNRELVGHLTNPAPAGRLLLHCLRLELPTLPDAGSEAWRTGTAAADDQQLREYSRRRRGGSEEARQVNEDNPEAHRQSGGGGDCFSGSDDGWTPPSEPDEGESGNEGLRSSAPTSVAALPTPYSESPTTASAAPQGVSVVGADTAAGEGGLSDEADGARAEGLEVYAEPPDDMLAFLRGMSWWEEGMIQEAERSARRKP